MLCVAVKEINLIIAAALMKYRLVGMSVCARFSGFLAVLFGQF